MKTGKIYWLKLYKLSVLLYLILSHFSWRLIIRIKLFLKQIERIIPNKARCLIRQYGYSEEKEFHPFGMSVIRNNEILLMAFFVLLFTLSWAKTVGCLGLDLDSNSVAIFLYNSESGRLWKPKEKHLGSFEMWRRLDRTSDKWRRTNEG